MIEKVNPSHPDKIADRIAGAIVDLAYKTNKDPRIAVEVLIGHGLCHVIIETSAALDRVDIAKAVTRIAGPVMLNLRIERQDPHLAENQIGGIRCGDNGIFKGMPLTTEQREISRIARDIYKVFPFDGKYILHNNLLTICQSNADEDGITPLVPRHLLSKINPLGFWTGGPDVDTGATNRKLGSDMADSVTGGGLHGKDLSKADVSVNVYAFLKAQRTGKPVELFCSIGDEYVDGKPYTEIVEEARSYIERIGGFEKFAEWGLF